MSKSFLCLCLFSLVLLPFVALAERPSLSFPLDCTLGEDCWAVNYVDVEPDPAIHKDFRCNDKTYEGHQGTDFALAGRAAMMRGVNVLAAADGKVVRVRDGESDSIKTEQEFEAIRGANKDCGNGVLLEHSLGLQTFYCHMKQGSLLVKPGETVKKGDILGKTGQSGFSEFPHLHFAVIWEGGYVDPFTGLTMQDGCGGFKKRQWEEDIAYEPFSVFNGGFRADIPDFDAIEAGEENPELLPADSQALVYWIGFYHAEAGDEVFMQIQDPAGRIFKERSAIVSTDRKKPTYFYTGRRMTGVKLTPGLYKGTTLYKRQGSGEQRYSHQILIK